MVVKDFRCASHGDNPQKITLFTNPNMYMYFLVALLTSFQLNKKHGRLGWLQGRSVFFLSGFPPCNLLTFLSDPKHQHGQQKTTLPTFNMVHLKMAPWNRRFRTLETIFRFQPLNLGECMFCCSLRFFQTKKPTKSQVLGFKHTAFSKKAVSAGPINFWPKSNCAKTLGSNTSNCRCGSRHKMGE